MIRPLFHTVSTAPLGLDNTTVSYSEYRPSGLYKSHVSTSLVFTGMKHKINDLNMTCGKI